MPTIKEIYTKMRGLQEDYNDKRITRGFQEMYTKITNSFRLDNNLIGISYG